ncbi:hypothetical protein [Nostoc sp.]|uniref:hypothetical protein n=1 Tax=Nostoc sp. TaxID=1180 RepID=UPI002FF7A6C4
MDISEHYKQLFQTYGDSPQACQWSSRAGSLSFSGWHTYSALRASTAFSQQPKS